MSNIIVQITLSISGHAKNVEKTDIQPVPQKDLSVSLTYQPEPNTEVWILGLKNAGFCSLGNYESEKEMDDMLKKYDLKEDHKIFLKHLNKTASDLTKEVVESNRTIPFTRSDQMSKKKIQEKGDSWAYFQQTGQITNKIFGGEPDEKRKRYIPVIPNGPTIKIYSVKLIKNTPVPGDSGAAAQPPIPGAAPWLVGNSAASGAIEVDDEGAGAGSLGDSIDDITTKMGSMSLLKPTDNLTICQSMGNSIKQFDRPIRLNELINYVKNTIIHGNFINNYVDFFHIMQVLIKDKEINWNFQIYDETCNHTSNKPEVPRDDTKKLGHVTAKELIGGKNSNNSFEISRPNKGNSKKHIKKHNKKHTKKHTKKHSKKSLL